MKTPEQLSMSINFWTTLGIIALLALWLAHFVRLL